MAVVMHDTFGNGTVIHKKTTIDTHTRWALVFFTEHYAFLQVQNTEIQ